MSDKKNPLSGLKNFTASELQQMDLEEPKYIVDDVLPEGTTLLVAKPKVGKTMFAQNVAVALALGIPALGGIPVEKGEVLFLALEGSTGAMQARLKKMLNGHEWPDSLRFVREFPKLDKNGLDILENYIKQNPQTKLIVIDTLAHVRAPTRSQNHYQVDYQALIPLSKIYVKSGVSFLVIHHANKMSEGDPLDFVSGTTGLTGAVDNILIMVKDPFGDSTTLHTIAREFEENELRFQMDTERATWILDGVAGLTAKTPERTLILNALLKADGPLGPKKISEITGFSYGSVRVMLPKMLAAGDVIQPEYGKYTIPSTPP